MLRNVSRRLFATKFDFKTIDIKNTTKSPEEVKKYLDPYGFIREDEWKDYKVEEKTAENSQKAVEKEGKVNEIGFEYKNTDIPEEYGFKVKGPEPTRYGDWESKGKCVDF